MKSTCKRCGAYNNGPNIVQCEKCTARVEYGNASVEDGVVLYSIHHDKFLRIIETHNAHDPIDYELHNKLDRADLFPDIGFGHIYVNGLNDSERAHINFNYMVIPYSIFGDNTVTYFDEAMHPEYYINSHYKSRVQ